MDLGLLYIILASCLFVTMFIGCMPWREYWTERIGLMQITRGRKAEEVGDRLTS